MLATGMTMTKLITAAVENNVYSSSTNRNYRKVAPDFLNQQASPYPLDEHGPRWPKLTRFPDG